MKNIILLIVLSTISITNAQWFHQSPRLTDKTFWDIQFISPETGWISGEDGFIFKTTDFGTTWSKKTFSGTIQSICFIDENNGALVTNNSVYKTTDGGISWDQKNNGYPLETHLTKVLFLNKDYGFVGNYRTILRTTDGGNNWQNVPINGINPLLVFYMGDILFYDSLNGISTGTSGVIARTSDGGISWYGNKYGDFDFHSICSSDSNTFFAAGGSNTYAMGGAIYKSTDKGSTWALSFDQQWNEFLAVAFADRNNGTAVGEKGYVARTNNGGASWYYQNLELTASLKDVVFMDSLRGIITGGPGGVVLRTTNAGETWFTDENNFSNDIRGVFFTDDNKGTAVGTVGMIIHTTNKGALWTRQNSGIQTDLNDISFSDENNAIAVGDFGVILKTTDGGLNWVHITSPSSYNLRTVYFKNNIGIIAGEVGTILRTTNGGTEWFKYNTGINFSLTGISFSDPMNGTVVGNLNTIFRTTNGGADWITQTTGTDYSLIGVSFLDKNNGMIVGNGCNIFKTTDGGSNWINVYHPGIDKTLINVHYTDINNATAVGEDGNIFTTTDGGANWFTQISNSTAILYDVCFTNTANGTIVGNGGTILRNEQVTLTETSSHTIPKEYQLSQNYPNPFNPTTKINYSIPFAGSVKISVYDIMGREVATLVNEEKQQGTYTVDFNASSLSSGVYFYQIKYFKYIERKKMLFIK